MQLAKLATLCATTTLLLSSPAFANFSFKGETTAMSSAYTWTGFYAGVNVGALNHTMYLTDTEATSFYATLQQVSNPALSGGLQFAYLRQLTQARVSSVYGASLSVDFSNATFQKNYGSPFALYQLDSKNSLNTLCLFQVLAGIAVEKTLMFLDAGLAWINITGSTTNLDSVVFFNSFSVSKSQFAPALGVGIQYVFTPKWSLSAKVDVIAPNSYTTSDNVGDTFQVANTIVQGTIGINYKIT
jgi:hypothetical protein